MATRAWAAGAIAILVGDVAFGQLTERVSVSTGGAEANDSSSVPSITADGRYVAFYSFASNLVAGDSNGFPDVFVRDRHTGTTELVSVATGGEQGNSASYMTAISADGRHVAFTSFASNLAPGDTNGTLDVFVRDRQSGTTELISVSTGGTQGDSYSDLPSISADGRYVAFGSHATNLVASDTNGWEDVFVRDILSGTTERVSVATGGAQGNLDSYEPSISADGLYVGFYSHATNLVPSDTNGFFDVFVRDILSGTTERVSVATGGVQGNSNSFGPSLSADARYVAFDSNATNLVASDTNGTIDVFVRDRLNGTTELVSVSTSGTQGNLDSNEASISADGRYVVFFSFASNLVAGDTNGFADVFVRDLQSGTTERVSVSTGGAEGNFSCFHPSISADARYVALDSFASNLVTGDTNGWEDVFVRDRDADGFTSLCDPGVSGVAPCPCSNPPSGPDRGCDNSSATGGASLSAAGAAYLSMDTLVFTTSGEKPTATSVVLQGNVELPSGAVFGQGVRCTGGALKRLFVKIAAGGSITAPDFAAGDPSVSTCSAALGDFIQAGQSRWYLVFYRDQIVLGGCPASSTFNATQTGRVEWSL